MASGEETSSQSDKISYSPLLSLCARFTVRNMTVNDANTGKSLKVCTRAESSRVSTFNSCLRTLELGSLDFSYRDVMAC
jgi:hypothetical protein